MSTEELLRWFVFYRALSIVTIFSYILIPGIFLMGALWVHDKGAANLTRGARTFLLAVSIGLAGMFSTAVAWGLFGMNETEFFYREAPADLKARATRYKRALSALPSSIVRRDGLEREIIRHVLQNAAAGVPEPVVMVQDGQNEEGE